MELNKPAYFEEIITDGSLFRSLRLFKTPPDGYVLCGPSKRSLFLYSLSEIGFGNFAGRFGADRPEPVCEILETESDIIDIVQADGELFVVDKSGHLYLLLQAENSAEGSRHFEETDIFEDSIREELKWRLEEKFWIRNCKVLAVSLLSCGLAILICSGNNLQIKIFQIKTFIELNTFNVDEMGSEEGLILSVPAEDIEAEYLKDWFCIEDCKEYRDISDVVFICCNGLVFLLPLSEHQPYVAVCIYETIQGVLNMYWSKDGLADKKSALQLVLSIGAVIKIHPFGEETGHMPLSQIVGVQVTGNIVLASNCDLCYKVEFGTDPVYVKYPHKGLIAFCSVSDYPDIILASTLHKSIYKININIKPNENFELMLPDDEQLNVVSRMVEHLDELNTQIQKEEDFHQSLSLVMRGPLLTKHISVSAKVVQILGSQHVFRVKIIIDLPGIIFLKTSWKVTILLSMEHCTYAETLVLSYDVSKDNPFIEFVKLDLPKFEESTKLLCRFICCDRSQEHFFCIPCGEFVLDATFFMLPLSSVPINQIQFCSNLPNANKGNEDHSVCTLDVELSLTTEPVDSIIIKILSNSKALWRSAEWKEAVQGTQIKAIIFGTVVKLELKDNKLEITSSNVEICHCVKIAVVKLLKWKKDLSFNHNLLCTVESLQHSLEVLQLEPEMNMEKLTELYQTLRASTTKIVL